MSTKRTNHDHNRLGRLLRELRNASGISQVKLCEAMREGLHPTTYKRYETGRRIPSDNTLHDLVNVFADHKAISSNHRQAAKRELLALKYSEHGTDFIRELVLPLLAQPFVTRDRR